MILILLVQFLKRKLRAFFGINARDMDMDNIHSFSGGREN